MRFFFFFFFYYDALVVPLRMFQLHFSRVPRDLGPYRPADARVRRAEENLSNQLETVD